MSISTIVSKCRRGFKIGKNFPGNIIENPVIVLCYHRVTKLTCDEHQLAVSPANFRDQIKYICENFPVQRFDAPWSHKKLSFVITFDDGYADNLYEALPILQEFSVPATFFVTSGFIGADKEFPWDGGLSPVRKEYRQLSHQELLQLAENELVTIGSHTLTHRQLSSLSCGKQRKEIISGHRLLEELVGKKLNTMSYPFGNYNDINNFSQEICRTLGIFRAAANYPGQAHSWTNAMAVPRHIIRNYDATEFRKRLFRFRFL